MGDSIAWCEENMEISVNEILTLELLCMSSFKNDKFQRSWWTEVVVTEKHSVLVSFGFAELGSARMDGSDPGALHERGLSWEYLGISVTCSNCLPHATLTQSIFNSTKPPHPQA